MSSLSIAAPAAIGCRQSKAFHARSIVTARCRPNEAFATFRGTSVQERARVVVSATPSLVEEKMSPLEVKAALLDSFWGTDRGLSASSETRAEINELINQLEAVNPCDNPTERMDLLGGTWKLLYSRSLDVGVLLSLSRLPLVEIEDIEQTIDPVGGNVVNRIFLKGPGSRSEVSTRASLSIQSAKRVGLRFEEGTLGKPELQNLDIPDSTTVLGQQVDLKSVRERLGPLADAGKSAVGVVESLLKQAPDVSFPIQSPQADTWLITSYLDEDLRISRGDGGAVYVLTRVSPGGSSGGASSESDTLDISEPAPTAAAEEPTPPPAPEPVQEATPEVTVEVVEPAVETKEENGSAKKPGKGKKGKKSS